MNTAPILVRDPVLVPQKPGIFAVFTAGPPAQAYIAYTTNLSQTSYGFASDVARGSSKRLRLTAVPEAPYTFRVIDELVDVDRRVIESALQDARTSFIHQGYELLGPRGRDQHRIRLDGQDMTLRGAMDYLRERHADYVASLGPDSQQPEAAPLRLPSYNTAWQRLARGYTAEQALGLEPAPPRWGKRIAVAP